MVRVEHPFAALRMRAARAKRDAGSGGSQHSGAYCGATEVGSGGPDRRNYKTWRSPRYLPGCASLRQSPARVNKTARNRPAPVAHRNRSDLKNIC